MKDEDLEKFALSIPYELKIDLLENALEENFRHFLELSKIYLKAPIDQGGLPTEVIDRIFKKHINE